MQALSQFVDLILEPIFKLIGGAKQLPLYLFLVPIPILLWLFWAEFRAAVGRSAETSAGEEVLDGDQARLRVMR